MTALSSGATRLSCFEAAAASEHVDDIMIGVVYPSTWVCVSLASRMVTPMPPPRVDTTAAAAVGADDATALLVIVLSQPQFVDGPVGTTAVSATVTAHVHGHRYPAAPSSTMPSLLLSCH